MINLHNFTEIDLSTPDASFRLRFCCGQRNLCRNKCCNWISTWSKIWKLGHGQSERFFEEGMICRCFMPNALRFDESTPPKTNGWNLKIPPKGKGETSTQSTNFWVPAVSFQGNLPVWKFSKINSQPKTPMSQGLAGHLSTQCLPSPKKNRPPRPPIYNQHFSTVVKFWESCSTCSSCIFLGSQIHACAILPRLKTSRNSTEPAKRGRCMKMCHHWCIHIANCGDVSCPGKVGAIQLETYSFVTWSALLGPARTVAGGDITCKPKCCVD